MLSGSTDRFSNLGLRCFAMDKLIHLRTAQEKAEKGKAQMTAESVDRQLATLTTQMEQLMREFYGSPQMPGISGQLTTMRKEITADQFALRRELTEKQDAIRGDFFEKQEELRRELTERQDRMQKELSDGQISLREDFITASSEIRGSVRGVLKTLGIVGAVVLGIPAIGTFILILIRR